MNFVRVLCGGLTLAVGLYFLVDFFYYKLKREQSQGLFNPLIMAMFAFAISLVLLFPKIFTKFSY